LSEKNKINSVGESTKELTANFMGLFKCGLRPDVAHGPPAGLHQFKFSVLFFLIIFFTLSVI